MSRPLHVILDVTARCNLKCVMCYFAETDRLHFPPQTVRVPDDGNMPVVDVREDRRRALPARLARGPRVRGRADDSSAISRNPRDRGSLRRSRPLVSDEFARALRDDARGDDSGARCEPSRPRSTESPKRPTKRSAFPRAGSSSWPRLELLADVKKRRRLARPRLRIIFTWMKSNRRDLRGLPAFAAATGRGRARRPLRRADRGGRRHAGAPDGRRPARVERRARGHGARGGSARPAARLRTPSSRAPAIGPGDPLATRAADGSGGFAPGSTSPNTSDTPGAKGSTAAPIPIGTTSSGPTEPSPRASTGKAIPSAFLRPRGSDEIARARPLAAIRDGLRRGEPIGSCATCSQRRTALYRLSPLAPAPEAPRLPTHPR